MGLHIGIPKVVKDAVHKTESVVSHPIRTAKNVEHAAVDKAKDAGKALLHDGFEIADSAFRHLTSAPNKILVKTELHYARVAQNRSLPEHEREEARKTMRTLMGGDPNGTTERLPGSCSKTAEAERSKNAKVWDPMKGGPNTPADWTTNDVAGKRKSDPVNMYVHGNLSDIVRAFQKGGWTIAEPIEPNGAKDYANALKRYMAAWGETKEPIHVYGHKHVPHSLYHEVNRMPVGDLHFNGQKQVIAMEANNHPLTGRDHFRIFWTGRKDAEGKNIYAIATSRDAGMKLDPHRKKTGFTNHFTERNADLERDYTLETLLAGGAKVDVRETERSFKGSPPGGLTSHDGKVYDVTVG